MRKQINKNKMQMRVFFLLVGGGWMAIKILEYSLNFCVVESFHRKMRVPFSIINTFIIIYTNSSTYILSASKKNKCGDDEDNHYVSFFTWSVGATRTTRRERRKNIVKKILT